MPLTRRKRRPSRVRVLTASAHQVDLNDSAEARRMRALRQGWQADAWNYRDSITELRYAIQFKANALSRMRLFVGVEPESGEADQPVPLADSNATIPGEYETLATEALTDLAPHESKRRDLLKILSTNIDVAGECRVLGQQDPQTGEEKWSVRSLDELVERDDGWKLRQVPDSPQGVIPWVDLDPDLTTITRIWVPHPRFELIADSPLKSMLQQCEALMILRRMIRAEGRSRLNRGLLLVPDELSIKVPEDDNDDPEADPFMSGLARVLTEPIGDEGVASAYTPGVIRGPADMLDKVKHLTLTQPFEEAEQRVREELVGNIATGFDLPKEVVVGVADLNHWSAWSVSDETFRHHLEPHTITCCDALTAGYFRPRIEAQGVPEAYARRLVIWYDPTELVTHPDQAKDALELFDRHIISAEAARGKAGFADEDAPSAIETMIRMLQNMRTPPANMVMAAMHELDPTLTIPPITVAGTVPGVKPSGVDPGDVEEPADLGPPALLPGPTVDSAPPAPQPPEHGEHAPPAITASGVPHERLSRKLALIDRDLRTRLQTAANAAMLKQLERVGLRLRGKVAKDETLKQRIAQRRNERVSAILGPQVVQASGVDAEGMMGEDEWAGLRQQYQDWTKAAQTNALNTARQMSGLQAGSPQVVAAETKLAEGREKGWEILAAALASIGSQLLYKPHPDEGPTDWADLNPDTLVQTGVIRAACAVAGGGDVGVNDAGEPVFDLGQPVGQIGTGATITELLETSLAVQTYEWEHASMTIHPFEPHLELDGVEFESFEDERLANSSGFPDNAYYLPGDHAGCSCDAVPVWGPSEPAGVPEAV